MTGDWNLRRPEGVTIRSARSGEAGELTELALRSKASWGYSAEFMAACEAELTITPERMAEWTIWVAEAEAHVCGMVALRSGQDPIHAELEDFFVDPDFQGHGVGSALMATVLEACEASGVQILGLDADPNAEAIYHRLGFTTVGRSPSGSIPGRWLPRMQLRLG
jgi:GNAT superfamily N-acetyltransferase